MGGKGSGRPSKLTPLQWEVAVTIVLRGDAKISEVARHYGITYESLRLRVGTGVPSPTRNLPMSAAEIQELRELYESGLSVDRIADQLGIDNSLVRRLIKRHCGVKPCWIQHTRATVNAILADREAGALLRQLARKYRLTLRQIEHIVRYHGRVKRHAGSETGPAGLSGADGRSDAVV